MEQRVLQTLEYDKILTRLAAHTVSDPGREAVLSTRPLSEPYGVEQLLSETQEAYDVCVNHGGNPLEGFRDATDSLFLCASGGLPSFADLLAIRRLLESARISQGRIGAADPQGTVRNLSLSIRPLRHLEEEIGRCILSEEEMADTASAELASIRRRIRSANERIRSRLTDMIANNKTYLQDAIVTMRNGRYVVPVRVEHMASVRGFVHDRSNTGATAFVEPVAILEANNELRELQLMEKNEMERVLFYLGGLVSNSQGEIQGNLDILTRLDAIFARARYAQVTDGVRPLRSESDEVEIQAARHPLIDPKAVVPIHVRFGGSNPCMVITGPNTGGKTVSLKTTGLFAMMAQSGMFLPCTAAKLPVFSNIFADIGDEQSIEQSLSTFSSHMVNIIGILEQAGPGTLTLLDELGAGTDPVEGAALAIAVMETLVARGGLCICTTHYSEVKSFAMTHPGFLNAGMEFDLASLRPTYRLIVGHVGSSNAFEISQRLGMEQSVIDLARSHVAKEAMAFENAIRKAEELRVEAERERDQALIDGERTRQEAKREREKIQRQADEELKRAKGMLDKALSELEQARQVAREAIEAAQTAARAERSREREQALHHARSAVREIQETREAIVEQADPDRPLDPKTVQVGQQVRLKSTGISAVVLTLPDARGDLTLQAGIMKIGANLSDLRMDIPVQPKKKPKKGGSRVQRGVAAVKMELDVRGRTVEEAMLEVDQYIDNAVLSGLHEVNIIHGKGTGALRQGLRQYLLHHPHVKSQRPGGYGEGEDGVTVLTLK